MTIDGTHPELLRAVELMSCGVLARDREGVALFANSRLLDWLQRDRTEVVGHPVSRLVPPELGDVINDEMRAIEGGDLRVRLTILMRKNGTTLPVLVVPQRLVDDEGAVLGGISILLDLRSVQTAKPIVSSEGGGLRDSLSHIVLELQSLAIAAQVPPRATTAIEHPALDALSPREREIVGLLLAGERVPSISKQLAISPHTARNHLKSVFRKLDVGNQAELLQHIRGLSKPPSAT